MALRVKDKNALALTEEQVLEIRDRWFYRYHSSRQIAEDYPVTEKVIRDAIYGNRGYSRIKDEIPQLDKDNRSIYKKSTASDKAQAIQGKRDSERLIREGVINPPVLTSYEPPKADRFKVKRQEVKPIKFWRDFE